MKEKFDTESKIFAQKYSYSPKLNAILFDTETDTINEELVLRLGYFKRILNGKEVEDGFFYNKDDFTHRIISYVGSNGSKTSYIWAHNTGFDFRVGINPHLFKNEFKLSTVSTNPFIVEYKKPIINELSEKDSFYSILFLDTFNFFKTSIEKLGDFFGIKKILIDFEDYERRKEIIPEKLLKERCKNDVDVIYKLLLSLYAQMPNRVKFSAAQLSYSLFKTTLPYTINKINTDLASLAYHGGRVEVFKRNEANVIKYDVNSMYPYVMLKYPYPIEILNNSAIIEPSIQTVEKYYKEGYGFICDATFNIPTDVFIPQVPYLREKDKKLIFPVGVFRTICASPEINFNHIKKFHRVEFYKMGKIFEPFVNKYYPLKQKAKGFMYEFYKIGVLNSCYGKFGQKYVETERFEQYDNKIEFGQISLEGLDNKVSLLKFLAGECFKNIGYGRKNSVAVADFVTSYARAELYKYIKKYWDIIYYVDTDCFVLPDNVKLTINKELGGLKIEGIGRAQFFTPKIYYFLKGKDFTMKLKGIKKSWNYDIIDDKIVAKGTRFTNFSESINQHNFKVKRVKEQKIVKLVDTKRIWKGNKSSPIILSL